MSVSENQTAMHLKHDGIRVGEMVVEPHLIAHEQVHMAQQFEYPDGIEGWWRKYIELPAFRMHMEVPAHQAEYRSLLKQYGTSRGPRKFYLRAAAIRH